MKILVESGKKLAVEERNLLSVAYKNVVGTRRSSWRVLSGVLEKKPDDFVKKYRADIKKELKDTCSEVIVSVLGVVPYGNSLFLLIAFIL